MPKKRKSGSSPRTRKNKNDQISEKIVENLIQLQRVHTDLAEKFDKLSKELSSLLNLFESAAKSFASNPIVQQTEKDKEFLDKIDRLLDQNKTIAKGLTLMEGKIKDRIQVQNQEVPETANYQTPRFRPPVSGKPLPRF